MNRPIENSGAFRPPFQQAETVAKSPVFYTRPDFVLFHAVETLTQKLGVTREHLRRVVLKELADNALDAGAEATVEARDADTAVVRDDGPGLPGTDADIADLFSTGRPLVSSKLLRMPTRGALGNGLRAVAGAVYASRGSLTVTTRGRRLRLTPEDDGTTSFTSKPCGETNGTTVEITFGTALPRDDDMLLLAETAINNRGGESYAGGSSPHWYDADAWHGLLQAAPADLTVRAFLRDLEGCSGPKAGTIAQDFKSRSCPSLSRDEATGLLIRARGAARPVRPERLGCIGPYADGDGGYAKVTGVLKTGGHEPFAEIPFVIEVWAAMLPSSRQNSVRVLVNRTPIVSEVRCRREPKSLAIFGAGLRHDFAVPGKTGFAIEIAVTTPFMPLTSDGKAPDLLRFREALADAIEKAVRKARRAAPGGSSTGSRNSQKAVVLDVLDDAIDVVSSGGALRYNLRNLFYNIRPRVEEAGLGALSYSNFETIVGDHENAIGHDLPGVTREPRGTYVLPHGGSAEPLGTLAVENYVRPPWTYGALLYIEKEGFAPILHAARWGERHDCVILSSKGQATRAVKDFIDLHEEGDEPILVFCVHDADAAGTLIHQALVEETRARGARQVEVINLGIEPWEGVDLGLPEETIERLKDRRPVADYVLGRDDGTDWEEWLQTHRIELNAFTPAAFIAWLDARVAPYIEKVVPPPEFACTELEGALEQTVRAAVIDRILREADVDGQVAAVLARIERPQADDLDADLETFVGIHRDSSWRERIADIASDLAGES